MRERADFVGGERALEPVRSWLTERAASSMSGRRCCSPRPAAELRRRRIERPAVAAVMRLVSGTAIPGRVVNHREIRVAASQALDRFLGLDVQYLDDDLRVRAPQLTHRRGHERRQRAAKMRRDAASRTAPQVLQHGLRTAQRGEHALDLRAQGVARDGAAQRALRPLERRMPPDTELTVQSVPAPRVSSRTTTPRHARADRRADGHRVATWICRPWQASWPWRWEDPTRRASLPCGRSSTRVYAGARARSASLAGTGDSAPGEPDSRFVFHVGARC